MTVDWHSPARILADFVILIKLIHVLGGVYIWEFVLNLDFEYSLLTGKAQADLDVPSLYLGCRWASISLVTVQFLGFDTSHEINCQVVIVMVFVFAYLTLMFASALIALRVIALWEHNKVVIAVAFTSWLANAIIYVYSTVNSHSLFLTLMLVGLLRWKGTLQGGGVFQLMYAQGLAWVFVVTLAEVPPAVFIALNLNDPMNMIFQALGLIIMSLGAPRIYRGLVDYPFEQSTIQESRYREHGKAAV
ncbi:hypothetical protein BJY52DRAFT_1185402 [Lactarius psammicola]|nr:hypothetical protein BJY52DRAFT_1185402 [Lactarius psammicola]